jgi:hypothetical protein
VLKQETPSLPERNPAIPAEFGRIVTKCLRKSPNERYQSARELLADLLSHRRDSEVTSNQFSQEKTGPSLFHRWLPLAGDNPFRQWEILHIRICLKCVLLVYLTWKLWTYEPAMWGLILSLAEVVASTAVYAFVTVLLYTGVTDRGNLGREVQRFGPWIRIAAWIAGVLGWAMAFTIAVPHAILAAFLLILGGTLVGSILGHKSALDARLSPHPPT